MSDQQDRLAALLHNFDPEGCRHKPDDRFGECDARAKALIAAGVTTPPTEPRAEGLREAAQKVVRNAEPDEGDEGYIEYLVPYQDIDALRAALAAQPTPAPLDGER
jgi:hypothetical protein